METEPNLCTQSDISDSKEDLYKNYKVFIIYSNNGEEIDIYTSENRIIAEYCGITYRSNILNISEIFETEDKEFDEYLKKAISTGNVVITINENIILEFPEQTIILECQESDHVKKINKMTLFIARKVHILTSKLEYLKNTVEKSELDNFYNDKLAIQTNRLLNIEIDLQKLDLLLKDETRRRISDIKNIEEQLSMSFLMGGITAFSIISTIMCLFGRRK